MTVRIAALEFVDRIVYLIKNYVGNLDITHTTRVMLNVNFSTESLGIHFDTIMESLGSCRVRTSKLLLRKRDVFMLKEEG